MNAPILKAMEFRHATKTFDPNKKIPEPEFQTLLEVARLSPTSFGLEAWNLVVVQNPELRKSLLGPTWGGQGQIPTASHLVALTVLRGELLDPRGPYLPDYFRNRVGMPEERVQGMLSRLDNFFQVEFELQTAEKRTAWAARQAYIVLGNMMTAAATLGIDSCAMEGFHRAQVEKILDGKGGFDRKTHEVACLVAFGYRSKDQGPRRRRTLTEGVVGWA